MLPLFPPTQTAPAAPSPADQQKRLDDAQVLATAPLKRDLPFDPKAYLQTVQHQPELLKAWDLTEGESWAPELQRARSILRLEIAWKLQDSTKMKSALIPYMGVSELSKKEEAYAFMASGQVGVRDLFLRLGQDIESKGGISGFHAKALENLSLFDFASMYKILVANQGLTLNEETADVSFRITHLQVRQGPIFCDAGSGQARAIAHLIQLDSSDYVSYQPDTVLPSSNPWESRTDTGIPSSYRWESRPDPTTQLLRIGQAVHWAVGSASPPCSGFISSDHIFMQGYAPDATFGDGGLQVVTYDLKREAPDSKHWSGNNTIEVFRPTKDGKLAGILKIVLNYQWDLVPNGVN